MERFSHERLAEMYEGEDFFDDRRAAKRREKKLPLKPKVDKEEKAELSRVQRILEARKKER